MIIGGYPTKFIGSIGIYLGFVVWLCALPAFAIFILLFWLLIGRDLKPTGGE